MRRVGGLVSCQRCEGFAEVLISAAPEGDVEVGHCLHEECQAWFSLPWARPTSKVIVAAAPSG